MGIFKHLKWALTGIEDYVPHPDSWVDKWVICTKTGEYVHVETGERREADTESVTCSQ